ncbi:FAD-binding oxidoreductase [Buchnera aphidicola (Kurisakia onigurumii)]|uniref:FAD-binding oxidoreductase n=1 Tax=Buchnera aphidicola TaxID=9 RepID=UPI0031B6A4AA
MNKLINAKITKIKKWSEKLFSIRLKSSINNFIPGQFNRIVMKYDDSKETIQRAYSYVNPPNNKNIEFYIVLIPNGKLTTKLYQLKKNDILQIYKNSFGFFTIEEIPTCENIWMIATGTAIGPYLSILQYKKNINKKFKKIILIYAVRYYKDLNYLKLLNKLKKKYKGKLYIQIILSREKKINTLYGRIPFLLQEKIIEKKIGVFINKDNTHIMLCGNPNMVKQTNKILVEKYFLKKNLRREPGNITIEHYW